MKHFPFWKRLWMLNLSTVVLLFSFVLLAQAVDRPMVDSIIFTFDFADDAQGWVGGFADYPQGEEDFYELEWAWQRLPGSIQGGGLFINGSNRSDDLFMFFKKELTGLESDTEYSLNFSFDLVTDVPTGCFGIGGAPGESVYVKAGATQIEPVAKTSAGGTFLSMNIDIGNQSQGGADMAVLGNVANSRDCESPPRYEIKPFTSEAASVTTDENGTLWFIIGTDSGFEGITSLYYTNIRIEAEPLAKQDVTLGDVNCDTIVNSVDGLFILQYDVGRRTEESSCPLAEGALYLPSCDVTGDDACNATDALFILQCDIGIANAFCAE